MEIPNINLGLPTDEFKNQQQFKKLIGSLGELKLKSYGSIQFNPNFLLNLSQEDHTALLEALSSIDGLIINLISRKFRNKREQRMIFDFTNKVPLSKFSVVKENSQLYLKINGDKHQLPPNSIIFICKKQQNLPQQNSREVGKNLSKKDD